MRQFRYSARAKRDLAEIHGHVFVQDAMTASLVVDRIEETIRSVCVFPQIGKETGVQGVWVFGGAAKSPFRITYSFNDERVSVVRIFRAQRAHIQH